MKKVTAQIVADSKNIFGHRVTSFILTFPRIILAELNTHRMLSRNSASSRAIPFKKMLELAESDPFIPIAWQKDHSGMQGTEYYTDPKDIMELTTNHLQGRDNAINTALKQSLKGLTKQICNRYLEPFMWHTALVTTTEIENFFHLRCPQYEVAGKIYRSKKDVYKDYTPVSQGGMSGILDLDDPNWFLLNKGQGEIHIMALAEAMWDAYNESVAKVLQPGQWHIPFGDKMDIDRLSREFDIFKIDQVIAMLKVATARCARVSYNNFDGTDDYGKDIALHDRLASSGHWSPFEHCAKAMGEKDMDNNLIIQDGVVTPGISGNFYGFTQYRKLFKDENKSIYVPVIT